MERKYFLLLASILCTFIGGLSFFSEPVFAEEINFDFDANMSNTQLNIKGAYLIEKYLLKYNQQLNDFKETNGIDSDYVIDDSIGAIKKLISHLRKIQTDAVSKEDAEKVMQKTIDSIKTLSKSLKVYLKNKSAQVREDAKIFQEKLVKTIDPFQKKLEKFIQNTETKIEANGVISREEKKVLSFLDELKDENIKLKTFKNLSFRNTSDIKSYMLSIILNIKRQMLGIKTSLPQRI